MQILAVPLNQVGSGFRPSAVLRIRSLSDRFAAIAAGQMEGPSDPYWPQSGRPCTPDPVSAMRGIPDAVLAV